MESFERFGVRKDREAGLKRLLSELEAVEAERNAGERGYTIEELDGILSRVIEKENE